MTTTKPSSIERERALAWLTRQLRWERTLHALRDGKAVEQPMAA